LSTYAFPDAAMNLEVLCAALFQQLKTAQLLLILQLYLLLKQFQVACVQ
jgi:hypothetical protein